MGCGIVFRLDSAGSLTVLYAFTGLSDGAYPWSALVEDSEGNLYGTTISGGNPACNSTNPIPGCGTLYKLDPSGNFTVLHTFAGRPDDGQGCDSKLTLDAKGNLYGVCFNGGSSDLQAGIVFKYSMDKLTLLHNFTGGSDGQGPEGQLLLDSQGNLYGVTNSGGTFDEGTVFNVTRSGNEAVLYSFGTNGGDGTYPTGGLAMDADENLYGTTYSGGASKLGTVFKLTRHD